MKIGVLNIYNFPQGMSATNRILAYCRGLVACGVSCEMISYGLKTVKNGNLCGKVSAGNYVQFAYDPCVYKKYNNLRLVKFVYRRIFNLYSKLMAIIYIYKSNKSESYDYIILSFDAIGNLLFFVPILRIFKIRLCAIADEYPIPIRCNDKLKFRKWRKLLYNIAYRGISKRILITKSLQKFYDNQICKKDTLIVSTIVDIDRFKNIRKDNNSGHEYMCYMGSLQLEKDNVDNIIRAYSLIGNDFKDIELRIYGASNEHDKCILISLISSLKLENRVFLCGRVSPENVPTILSNAKILVMSQPQTKRSEGGFPTKIGEYLSSGVPSIVTNVGEMHNYIQDRVTGYLVEPCNPRAYANTMNEILNDYNSALDVAKNAQNYVSSNFSGLIAGKKMFKFLFDE